MNESIPNRCVKNANDAIPLERRKVGEIWTGFPSSGDLILRISGAKYRVSQGFHAYQLYCLRFFHFRSLYQCFLHSFFRSNSLSQNTFLSLSTPNIGRYRAKYRVSQGFHARDTCQLRCLIVSFIFDRFINASYILSFAEHVSFENSPYSRRILADKPRK